MLVPRLPRLPRRPVIVFRTRVFQTGSNEEAWDERSYTIHAY